MEYISKDIDKVGCEIRCIVIS